MKRVLHVLHSLERSGMEMMLLNSYDEWCRLGYKCDVVATADTVGPLATEMRNAGYSVFHMPFRSKYRYLPKASFLAQFYRLCISGYDILHIHTEMAPSFYAVLARLAGVRQIAMTPHNVFNFRGTLRARKFCERQLIRFLGGRFGFISEGVKKCEWERFRIKGTRICNWLDTSHFRPPTKDQRDAARKALGLHPEQFVIVSVGNCSEIKNHEAILRAMLLLPVAMRLFYLHIGREQDDLPERRLAAELEINDKIAFLGAQDNPLPFLWAADVFVMPSLHEGLGMAAIEAIAAGVPSLLGKVAGLSEVAAMTKWATLASPTPESLAESLIKLAMVDPAERLKTALSDSQTIREQYSIQHGVLSVVQGLYAEPSATY